MTQQPAITLEDVNRAMTARRRDLSFPEPIEQHFAAEMDARRGRAVRRILPRTLVIYNAFIIGDHLLTPDAVMVSWIVHFLVVTPWIIAVILLMPKITTRLWRDLLVASLPLSIVAGVLAVFAMSRSPFAEHYQYFVIVALLYGNAVLRPSLPLTLAISAVTVVAHAVVLALHPAVPVVVAVSASACLMVASYVSLATNAAMERDLRRLYLMRLSESLIASDLERAAADLHRIALVDPLTGLANRRGIDARAAALSGGVDGGPFAVLMIDVDRFKSFNDHYGHPEGDRCLAAVALAIRESVCGGVDVAGRYGGEEFLVLLPGATLAEAQPAAERIRRAIEDLALPHAAAEWGVVSVSIGLAAADGLTPETFPPVVAAADAALYVAKQAGRNRVHAAGQVPPIDTAGRRSRPVSDAA
ncbi:diguanylate cyclase [Phreatobacter sp.]|uniref:GGDEF domain-containing protein n=1 Tax=Phreatobacter sp. TaxID=1966341 RepID=UPI0022C35AD5|nr:diguanylate cyclase [Phreatobacter sp.]MCZ8315284.1 GGDEF domain-containing protein [Phreatobacter sp.]